MLRRTSSKVLLLILTISFLCAVPISVSGEEEEGEEDLDFMELSLEELMEIEVITVTARKRAESIQATPVSVTAFSGQALEERGITRIEEIERYVPNMTFEDGTFRGASIYLRGVGQRDSRQFLEPGVGVYIDGVYVAHQSALLPLMDVERIEVLRGPQGTLYGRNTIGGAVNFITKKPAPGIELSADLLSGNYKRVETRLSANVPIVEDLVYSRVAFASKTRRGYTQNVADDNQRWDDDSLLAVSPSVRILPLEDVTVDLRGHYTRQNMRQRAGKCFVSDEDNALIAGLEAANTFFATDNPDVHGICERDEDLDFYEFSASTSGIYQLETWGTAATIDYHPDELLIFDDISVKSITAWHVQSEFDKQNDIDGSSAVLIDRTYYEPHEIQTISQELTLTGVTTIGEVLPFVPDSVGEGAIYPTLGAYFSWEESSNGRQDNVAVGGGGPLFVPNDPVAPTGVIDITESANPEEFNIPQIDNESRAVYTQLTVEPLDFLHLTGGVRYTWEKKRMQRFEPGETAKRSETFSKVTPMGSVKLLAPESWMAPARVESAILYYTYAEGFKGGGFNEITDETSGDPLPGFDEETLESHEVGLKIDALDSRLVVNLAYFHTDYEDMQLNVIRTNPTTFQIGASTTNAGEAQIQGVELELAAVLLPGLKFNGSFGYVDAEYKEFEDSVPGSTTETEDRSDEPLQNIPKWTANAGLQYTVALNSIVPGVDLDLGRLTPRWDYSYKSKRAYHVTRAGFETGLFKEGSVHLHDIQLTWESSNLRYEAGFFMKNVFDEEYINGALDVTDFFGTGQTRAGIPRMWGFEIAYRYF